MATITRDETFPAEAAQLMAMLNKCCEAYDVRTCLMAIVNLQAASFNVYAAAHQMNEKERRDFIEAALEITRAVAEKNNNRAPCASDIPVKPT